MIEWSEFDGGEWFPQFRVGRQESMYRNSADYRSRERIASRLEALGHRAQCAYLSEFSWTPTLGAADFYQNFVRRLYGSDSESIAKVYGDNDAMEPTIPCCLAGLPYPNHFSNGWAYFEPPQPPTTVNGLRNAEWRNRVVAVPAHAKLLRKIQATEAASIAALRAEMPKLDAFGRSQAELLANRFEVRIRYIDAMLALDELAAAYDAVAAKEGIAAARLAAAKLAGKAADHMREAIEEYVENVRNRSDIGVVAQMNEQFYQPMKKVAEDLTKTGVAGKDK